MKILAVGDIIGNAGVKELQKELLERNKTYIGEDTTDIALEDLEKEIKKGAKKNVQKEKKNTTRRNTK